MEMRITNNKARNFLLNKQLLFTPKLNSKQAIETVCNHLRIIQYDPLNPCGRNPDLVFQSRIKSYHPNDYHHWLYTEKKGIEAYDKELCILPIEDFEFTTHRNIKATNDLSKQSFIKIHQKEINQIIQKIKTNGPICSSDIQINKQVKSGWGSNAQFGRIALEFLWKMGLLVISKRDGMKKFYDFPENIHPTFTQKVIAQKLQKKHIIRRIKSVGLLPKSTNGGGWQGLGNGTAKFINELIEQKVILEIKVENSNLTYIISAEDLEQLHLIPEKITHKEMKFIAPLDNLIWDRNMVADLFKFHYRWEVYTPTSKRKFGYYVLPILYGNEFIGRIEPVINRKLNSLEIKGLWFEREWKKSEWSTFQKALLEFNDYLQTTTIDIPYYSSVSNSPSDLA